MGNQCCSATNTTSEQPPLAPIKYDEPEGETGGEGTTTIKHDTPMAHNAIVEEAEAEQVAEQQEKEEPVKARVIESFKFKKQLERLRHAMTTVESLQGLAARGAQISQAINELQELLSNIRQTSQVTETVRLLKKTLQNLHSSLQLFRSFHLRYTLDEKFYNNLNDITAFLTFQRDIISGVTKDNAIDYQSFYNKLDSEELQSEFNQHKQNIERIVAIYNQISGQNFSTLPNYLYIAFNDQRGFSLWEQLFSNEFETTNVVFSQKYSEYCGVESEKILEIISLLDSANDRRVDIYQWLDFVNEYSSVFDENLKITQEKLSDFTGEIESKAFAMNAAPQQLEDKTYQLQSGMIFEGTLDENQRKTGAGILRDEGYSLSVEFVDDLAQGYGVEQRKSVNYEGYFLQGLYHGYGTLTFPNGRSYRGHFENHQFHGEGELIGDDGIKYAGNWQNGQLSEGTITYHDGSYYTGSIQKNFFKHGTGSLYAIRQGASETFLFIKGQWNNDSIRSGEQFNPDSSLLYNGYFTNWSFYITATTRNYIDAVYSGDLNYDDKFNKGTITYKGGDSFTGSWANDAKVKGTYYYTKEKTHFYEGEFKNGVMQGKGKVVYEKGGEYEGDIVEGKRNGYGSYRYQNGNVYTGQWVNNIQQGEGKFQYVSASPDQEGDLYSGQFSNGKFHGYGHYIYTKSGKNYLGEWEDDRWVGEGIFYDGEGNVLKSGNWKEDKLVIERPEVQIKFPENLSHLVIKKRSS